MFGARLANPHGHRADRARCSPVRQSAARAIATRQACALLACPEPMAY